MAHPPVTPNSQLKKALEAFSRSPRFSLFQRVKISRLIPEGCEDNQSIGELTIDQLVERVQESRESLDLIAPEHAEALSNLLAALGEDNESPDYAFSGDMSADQSDDLSGSLAGDQLSINIPTLDDQRGTESLLESVDPPKNMSNGDAPLEFVLRATLTKIAAHSQYQHVRTCALGKFWSPEWTAAPFEEALTIEQLAALDPALLLKKRMVTDTRIQSIVQALHRAQDYLEELERVTSESSTSKPALKSRPNKPNKAPKRARLIKGSEILESDVLMSSLGSPVRSAVQEALQGGSKENLLTEVLISHLSIDQCVGIVCGDQVTSRTLSKLGQIIEQILLQQKREVVKALLRAPAVRITQIARVVSGLDADLSAHSLCLAALVARGFGAVPIKCGATACAEFWSKDPELVSSLLKRARSLANRPKHKIPKALNESLALLDPELLELYLKPHKKT